MNKVIKGDILYRGTKYGVFKVQVITQMPSGNVLVRDLDVPSRVGGFGGFVKENAIAYTVDCHCLVATYGYAARAAKELNLNAIASANLKLADLEFEIDMLNDIVVPQKEPEQRRSDGHK